MAISISKNKEVAINSLGQTIRTIPVFIETGLIFIQNPFAFRAQQILSLSLLQSTFVEFSVLESSLNSSMLVVINSFVA